MRKTALLLQQEQWTPGRGHIPSLYLNSKEGQSEQRAPAQRQSVTKHEPKSRPHTKAPRHQGIQKCIFLRVLRGYFFISGSWL